MSKSVLISIQPYWFFLIIAESMGWYIGKVKTEEIRKNFPKDSDWDRTAIIYCSKDKKSFNRIPKKYQPLMERFLGKVGGEFVCPDIVEYESEFWDDETYESIGRISYDDEYGEREKCIFAECGDKNNTLCRHSCLSWEELRTYIGQDIKTFYGWRIMNLEIYKKPKELSEFEFPKDNIYLSYRKRNQYFKGITRPPQSWCYVEADK